MHQENRYLAALRAAERFEVDGPFLYIYTAGESLLLLVAARLQAGAAPLDQ
jgi:hypothetical protein